ncbi:nucleoside deaminase [Brucella sp. 21LCYQ03]|nr:nucleoside deaminase [Brucella sp. 21LCYQ03]
MSASNTFLSQAIALAFENIKQGGRPFGAVVVKNDKIIGTGVNRMQADCDPTAHAELLALRAAGQALQSVRLDDCTVYASGQPCPMCFAAMRMSGIKEIIFAYSNDEAEPYNLSTAQIAKELARPINEQTGIRFDHCSPQDEAQLYRVWQQKQLSEQ